MKEDKLFYVGQKAFIENGGKVLVLRDPDLGIDFPGGKIQEDEKDFAESLIREVKEETNLEIEVGSPFITWIHKMTTGVNKGGEIFIVGYKCSYLSGEVMISNEHDSYLWVDRSDLGQLDHKDEYFKYLDSYFNLGI
ncbi:MAG: NUDIX domain-containing protein [Candidatus Woykebacteria bacterium]